MEHRTLLRPLIIGAVSALLVLAAVAARAHGPGDESQDMATPDSAGQGNETDMFVGRLIERQLAAARDLLDKGKTREAIGRLEDMEAHSRAYNRYENAILHQTLGYAYATGDDYAKAADAFKEALAFKALPKETTLAVMQNLGQLYIATDRYDQGIAVLEDWMKRAPPAQITPQLRVLLGNAFFHQHDYPKAAAQVSQAVGDVKRASQAWYQLLAAIYQQWGHYGDMAGVLQQAVSDYPHAKEFWQQLAAAYRQDHDDSKAAAALALACRRGLCTADDKLYLARLYLYLGVPLKSARLLRDALKDSTLAARAQPWMLLAQSWQQARELDNAEGAYREAVKRAGDDGTAAFRLGQLYVQQEKWASAAEAFTLALGHGHLQEPGRARLLLGVSQLYLGHPDEAAKALEAARHDPEVNAQAQQWLAQVQRSGTHPEGLQGARK